MAFRNLENEAEMIKGVAKMRLLSKDFVKALELYRQSIELMGKADRPDKVEEYQKEYEAALYGRAQEINDEGDKYYAQKAYKEAIDSYQEAWDLVQQAGEPYISKVKDKFTGELRKAKVAHVQNVFQPNAEKMASQSKWEFAIGLYIQILSMFDPIEDKEEYNRYLNAKNNIYSRWAQETNKDGDKLYKKGDYQNAIEVYVRSVQLVEKSGDTKLMQTYMKALNLAFSKHAAEIKKVGDKMMKEKKFKEASEFYSQSLKIAEGSGNEKIKSNIQKELFKCLEKYAQSIHDRGDDYMIESKFEQAADVYLESLNLARETENIKLIVEFEEEYHRALEYWANEINTQGKIMFNQQKWEEASAFFAQAVSIIEKTNNQNLIEEYRNLLHSTYLEMAKQVVKYGDTVFERGEYQQAYDYYDYSVKMAQLAGNEMYAQNYMLERNRALKKLNENK